MFVEKTPSPTPTSKVNEEVNEVADLVKVEENDGLGEDIELEREKPVLDIPAEPEIIPEVKVSTFLSVSAMK